MDHRAFVGRGFRIGGWLLGVPSLLGLLTLGFGLFLPTAPAPKSAYLDVGKYGIAGLIANGAKGVSDLFDGLGDIAAWVGAVLAGLLAAALAFAAILYLTGRGIARGSTAAGGMGIALAMLFLLFWTIVLLSLNHTAAMVLPVAGIAMAGYAVWVLGWR